MKKIFIMFALVVMTMTCSVNMNAQFYNDEELEDLWPEYDDDTIEAAAKALPTKLIGTWVSEDENGNQFELVIGKNNVVTAYLVSTETHLNGIDVALKMTGTWTKKKGNLLCTFSRSKSKAVIAPYDEKDFKALSSAQQSKMQQMLDLMNSPQFKGQVESMLPSKIDDEIYYLDNNFLVIGDFWFVKLSSIPTLLKK